MTAVQNKIPNVNDLVKKKKQTIIIKISEIESKFNNYNHEKYITTSEFIKLTTENFKTRLAQADLVTKADFDDKLKNLNKKITSKKTKHFLVKNELKNLKTFDSSYFKCKDNFEEDYLAFKSM